MSVVNIDYTHVSRHVSGLERTTTEQFNKTALAPLQVRIISASEKRIWIMLAQMVGLPLHAIRNRSDIYLFPGFPPSPFFSLLRNRAVLFVHDLFLLTRRSELNRTGKYYMAPSFYVAIKNFRHFLTNSENTANQLRAYCHPNATIVLCRPHIRNVFGLTAGNRAERSESPAKLRVLAVGTIEPRKNFPRAVKICEALSKNLRCEVELHIIGRIGWGKDARVLRDSPNVILHGYLDDIGARPIIDSCDLLLSVSLEEGLCLPLIEVQYSGMPVAAPCDGVFSEVVGESGILINSNSPERAADRIAQAISVPGWRSHYASLDKENISRWNTLAEKDRKIVISFLSGLGRSSRRD